MAEVYDMYKIARYVDSNRYQKSLKKTQSPLQAILMCAKQYAQGRFWRNERKANDWLENAIKHKYVEVRGDSRTGHWLKVTPGRGMQLVAKHWLIFRSGLREQTLKEYPRSVQMYKSIAIAVIGLVSTAIGAVAGAIVTYALTHP